MIVFLAVILPFISAFFIPYLYKRINKVHTGWFVIWVPLILFLYFVSFLPLVSGGKTVTASVPWAPSLGLDFAFYIDGLGLLFAMLITGIGALVVLYSVYYLSRQEKLNNFYVFLMLFMGAMLGIVLSDNLIAMYLFWEFTSFSSFLLIGYWYHRKKSVYGAQKSLLVTVLGGFFMLIGIVMISNITGSFSIRDAIEQAEKIQNSPLFIPILLFLLLGAFSKSAQFPFHIWLPDAMEAPTPVSAYLHSATMVKAGIYLVARFSPVFAFSDAWFLIVTGIGMLTLCWCSFLAVKQTDLKGILAYSTVSQLGLIMTLLGIATPAAVTAAIFHLFNHATFKGALFLVAGIVDHETGTRDIRKLGGLLTFMPMTATAAFIGALSMAGVPPFSGFLSKEMFMTAMAEASTYMNIPYLLPVLAVVGSIFTFVYSVVIFFKLFLGEKKTGDLEHSPHEAPKGMLVAPLILVLIVVFVGLFPNLIVNSVLKPTVEAITLQSLAHLHITHWHGWGIPVMMTLIVFGLGIVIYRKLPQWLQLYEKLPARFSVNFLYESILKGLERFSVWITKLQMTGILRNYLAIILVFIMIILSYHLYFSGGFRMSWNDLAEVQVYELILAGFVIVAAITSVFLNSRIAVIIAVGSVGYGVSLFFVILRAPDLALTQLVIETISVALFLLCFVHLPRLGKELTSVKRKWQNAMISVAVGFTLVMIGISAHSTRLFETISSYYVENSYTEAGGKNVVNVILVDFRGLDTMLEILVLGISALGVYAMIRIRTQRKGEDEEYEEREDYHPTK